MSTSIAIQDQYRDHSSHCYGCGRLNSHGLQIKSYWEGEHTVCRFQPQSFHTAVPGYVYGGLIASVIDCHATGTAAAAAYKAQGRSMDTDPELRYVTASLHVEYLRPTPIDVPMEVRGQVTELKGRKAVVEVTVTSKGRICARGTVVTVQAPEDWLKDRAEST